MKINRVILLGAFAMSMGAFALDNVEVKSVEAHQRYPWNGLVDIVVTMEGAIDDWGAAWCFFAATNSATQAAVVRDHDRRTALDAHAGGGGTLVVAGPVF